MRSGHSGQSANSYGECPAGWRAGTHPQVITTIIKFAALAFMATVGLFYIEGANFTPWNVSQESAIGVCVLVRVRLTVVVVQAGMATARMSLRAVRTQRGSLRSSLSQ